MVASLDQLGDEEEEDEADNWQHVQKKRRKAKIPIMFTEAARDFGLPDDGAEAESISTTIQEPADSSATADAACIVVRDLELEHFWSKLIAHFDHAYNLREVKWPSRTGVPEPSLGLV